jgi:predicted SnoaL-like aldol condensation-catalyzing enzyme
LENYKIQVLNLLKNVETRASEPLVIINPDKYVEHNLGADDGLASFRKALPKASTKVLRVFHDDPFVFTHTDFGSKIGFDIFRFKDGKIVEHWDNLQETRGPNPSGHTMIDGPTQSNDIDRTKENKRLVREFVDDVHVKGRLESLDRYFDDDRCIQHSPLAADDFSGLRAL